MRIGFDAKKIVKNLTGIGNYSRCMVNALSEYYPGNRYVLFAPSKGNEQATGRLHMSQSVGFCYPSHVPGFLKEWWRCRGVVKDIDKNHIELFHGLSNELPFGIRKAHCRSVVTIHDLIFLRYPETYTRMARAVLRFKTRYACRNADRIVAISEQTKRDIIQFYNIPPEKISIVYQGCDSIYYTKVSDDKIENVLRKYGLPARYLLSVGTFEKRKNQKSIIEALPLIDDDIHLVLVGKRTEYEKELVSAIENCRVGGRVHVLHDVPNADLPALYQGCSAFAYMSYFEGFGIPILEALVSGVPIVAATGSCLEEAGGPSGLYCDPFDIKGIAGQIEYVLKHPEQMALRVEEGKNYAKRFTEGQIAKTMMDVYKLTLSSPR